MNHVRAIQRLSAEGFTVFEIVKRLGGTAGDARKTGLGSRYVRAVLRGEYTCSHCGIDLLRPAPLCGFCIAEARKAA